MNDAPKARSALGRELEKPWLRAVLPLLVVLVLGAVFNQGGAFFEWDTHRALLREVSVLGILACGMTVVIVAAGIDLSVGSVLALSAVSFALFTMHRGMSGFLAIPVVLLLGTLLGLVSGALVAAARIQAFIVTLAMMVFARGLAKELSGGQKVSSYFQAPDGRFVTVPQPAVFEAIDSRVLGGAVSIVTLVFLASALVTWLVSTFPTASATPFCAASFDRAAASWFRRWRRVSACASSTIICAKWRTDAEVPIAPSADPALRRR